MTTRRWMLAVAVVAGSFAGYRYAVGLRQMRNDYLARAAEHARLEVQGRQRTAMARRGITLATNRLARPQRPEPAPTSPTMTSGEIKFAIDHVIGLPVEGSYLSQGDASFREAQARMHARRKAVAEYYRPKPRRLWSSGVEVSPGGVEVSPGAGRPSRRDGPQIPPPPASRGYPSSPTREPKRIPLGLSGDS